MSLDQIVIDTYGPVPNTPKTFQAESNAPCTLSVSATVYSSSANATVGLAVVVDGKKVGEIRFFCNLSNVHVSLPVRLFTLTLDIGAHTLQLVPLTPPTVTDANDYFQAVIEY